MVHTRKNTVETIKSQLTVVGGGLSGICAAIMAARQGVDVVLVNDRPVLGGNSSSEVRVWALGASVGFNHYARETGVIDEIRLENNYRNPEGNPHIWDMILLDFVKREPNIRLFLNTVVHNVKLTHDERRIQQVEGLQLGSERRFAFVSPYFIDASGDGTVAYLSGASYRMGREARDEYGESFAPEVADNATLGSTIFFYTKDVGRKVEFTPPRFAYDLSQMEFYKHPNRRIRMDMSGCDYWWFEYGGQLDTIKDNEAIRDELWKLIWGIWDYIKNSGEFDADNLALEWVGSIPGKRESRRFLGDYVLTQNDLQQQRRFEDAVCYGGWSIDTHPPAGIYSSEPPCTQINVGVYDIPYRCLYSRDIHNLFLAGRIISASHIAFASTRVMITCALTGQAVGMAASLCLQEGILPRDIYENKDMLHRLQQRLLKEDHYIIGIKNEDSADIAREAVCSASSVAVLERCTPTSLVALKTDTVLSLPLVDGRLEAVSLWLQAHEAGQLQVELFDTGKPENWLLGTRLASATIEVKCGPARWYEIPLQYEGQPERTVMLVLKATTGMKVGVTEASGHDQLPGVLTLTATGDPNLPLRRAAFNLCFRCQGGGDVYSADMVINGYTRPYGLPNAWVSARMRPGRSEWLELSFREEREITEIRLYFGADLDSSLNNLRPTGPRVFPDTVKDYRLWARIGGQWRHLVEIEGNYQRLRIHRLRNSVVADAVKLEIMATNGSPWAQVYGVRVY